MLILDLFCGAGGCSEGYRRAGFTPVGVDNRPQPSYPFDFAQCDAVQALQTVINGGPIVTEWKTFQASDFVAVHASPPCQAHSVLKYRTGKRYADFIPVVRELLNQAGLSYVIENVVGSPLINPVMLCGSSFGLGVRRHRLFESNVPLIGSECRHDLQPYPVDISGTGATQHCPRKKPNGGRGRKPTNLAHARKVSGIDWMDRKGLSQAVPPAYTEFIGQQLARNLIGS